MAVENNGRILTWALDFASIIAMGLACLVWLFNANADLKILQTQVALIVSDKETDIKQTATLQKHWKLRSWARDRVTELRQQHSLSLEPWPDLDNSP